MISPRIALIALHFIVPVSTHADAPSDYENYELERSPKRPWRGLPSGGEEAPRKGAPTWRKVALWLPNRILDIIDVVKLDVGVGPSYGGVVRMTKYAQAGYRSMDPVSVRFGLMGRDWPVEIEHDNEIGLGPAFHASRDRSICRGEIGLGLDLFIVGGYGGICVDELLDLILGFSTVDIAGDDLR